ncbi:hypothetical protein ACYSUO_39390 [Streptomyces sp. UC4497]
MQGKYREAEIARGQVVDPGCLLGSVGDGVAQVVAEAAPDVEHAQPLQVGQEPVLLVDGEEAALGWIGVVHPLVLREEAFLVGYVAESGRRLSPVLGGTWVRRG